MLKYKVKPEIEAYDLSHIHQAVNLSKQGKLKAPLYVQFVMGVKKAMPVDKATFDFYIETLKRLAPDAQWCGAGIGASQYLLNEWSIAAGGHTRTGLEDNIRLDRDTLAPLMLHWLRGRLLYASSTSGQWLPGSRPDRFWVYRGPDERLQMVEWWAEN